MEKSLHYSQGSFTPTFTFGTPGDLSNVYTTQEGYFIRVGNMVWFQMRLAWTPTHTTASGNATFAGLPYTSNPGRVPCSGIFTKLDYGAGESCPMPRIGAASTTITISMQVDNGNPVNATTTHFATAVAVIAEIAGSYQV